MGKLPSLGFKRMRVNIFEGLTKTRHPVHKPTGQAPARQEVSKQHSNNLRAPQASLLPPSRSSSTKEREGTSLKKGASILVSLWNAAGLGAEVAMVAACLRGHEAWALRLPKALAGCQWQGRSHGRAESLKP